MAVDKRLTGTWVTDAHGRPGAMQIRRCRLSVIGGPDTGTSIDSQSSVIRVGAHPGNDLVINDRRVSGYHLEIQLERRGFRLRDLDSTNGTWVSGHRVRDIDLNPGSVIYIGDARIRFDPQDSSVEVALSPRDQLGSMVGQSVAMRALFATLEQIAASEASVLVTGETGTGKELVAEALHETSNRSKGPFVVVDCGSLPANLIESELFGHEKGAFTGAVSAHAGVFERANGGTVFLDEIGELPLDLQPKLLGALERRRVTRIGGTRSIPVDFRVVAATNRDLAKEMNQGRFREDLFYRLAVVRVKMPALRERIEDVPLLAKHFLSLLPGGQNVTLRPETLRNLQKYDFPGNVRELRNLIERAIVMATVGMGVTSVLSEAIAESPTSDIADRSPLAPSTDAPAVDADEPYKPQKNRVVEQFDRAYLKELLKKHGGNVSSAARAAGLDRMTVHKMLTRYGVPNIRGGSD